MKVDVNRYFKGILGEIGFWTAKKLVSLVNQAKNKQSVASKKNRQANRFLSIHNLWTIFQMQRFLK